MKYDIGDIVLLWDIHFMIIDSSVINIVPFYTLESLGCGTQNKFAKNTLDRSCKIVQKGKR